MKIVKTGTKIQELCTICDKKFDSWFHGQGSTCPECSNIPRTIAELKKALPDWEVYTDYLTIIRAIVAKHKFRRWGIQSEIESKSRKDWRKCISSVYLAAKNFEKEK